MCLVPYVFSCFTCRLSYVLSCSTCLLPYVLSCLTFFLSYVPSCLTCLVFYLLSCLTRPVAYLFSCLTCLTCSFTSRVLCLACSRTTRASCPTSLTCFSYFKFDIRISCLIAFMSCASVFLLLELFEIFRAWAKVNHSDVPFLKTNTVTQVFRISDISLQDPLTSLL